MAGGSSPFVQSPPLNLSNTDEVGGVLRIGPHPTRSNQHQSVNSEMILRDPFSNETVNFDT